MDVVTDRHTRGQIAAIIREVKKRGAGEGTMVQRQFKTISDMIWEPLFTFVAGGGLGFFLNGDYAGAVITEQQSAEGTKPDHILRRTLANGRRTQAIVENKLAKPDVVNKVVSQKEIDDKMREAIQHLARYYHTYRLDTDALLAVVYAPSAARPTQAQFTADRLEKKEEERLFDEKPCFQIVIRVDLGGK
jgi:hypothetical protein